MKNYYLMNKDRVVAEFYSQKGRFSRKDAFFEIGCIYDKMPFGAEEDLTASISLYRLHSNFFTVCPIILLTVSEEIPKHAPVFS